MKGGFGRPNPLSYIYLMLKQIIIGKILWCQGDETFYGTFDTMDAWEKWAEDCMEDDDGEIEEISYEIMYDITKDLATTE